MTLFVELTLSAVLAVSQTQTCSWDNPGADPYQGDVANAVDHYTDIPAIIRNELKVKMTKRKYDDLVIIKRNSINGLVEYEPEIQEMHFGKNRICKNVTRAKWLDTAEQRALVYCAKTECIIVPLICRNVSRVRRKTSQPSSTLGANDYTLPIGPGFVYHPSVVAYSSPITPRQPYATNLSDHSLGWPSIPLIPGPITTESDLPRPPVIIPPLMVVIPVIHDPQVIPPLIVMIPDQPIKPIASVPEPNTYLLFVLGFAALWYSRRTANKT